MVWQYECYGIPLMQKMSLAGWEPVTWATAGDSGLWVERYGPDSSGTAYFAVRNPSAGLRAGTLSIQPGGFDRSAAGGIEVADALTGLPIAHTQSAGEVTAAITVPLESTLVVRVDWPR